jgi:raffinose/stachyose/melibiose transport system substrate-binding protein
MSPYRVRLLTVVVAALCAATVAVPASAGAASSTPNPSQVTGSLRMSLTGDKKPGWERLIAHFKRMYPNVQITATFETGGAVRGPLIAAQLRAGTASDVLSVNPGKTSVLSLHEYARAGYLADLSKAEWVKRTPGFMKPLTSFRGKYYGWTMRVAAGPGVIYNTALFRSLGLRVPRTFAEFTNLCRTIRRKAPGLTPMEFLGSVPDTRFSMAMGLASTDVFGKDPKWNT